MEKYKVSEEYELQNVEAPFTPIDKYVEDLDFSVGYFRECPYTTSTPRYLPSSIIEPAYNISAFSLQRQNEFLKSIHKSKRCIDVCIFFTNKIGVSLEVEDGHIATADELMHFAVEAEEVCLTSEAIDVLALWFVSPFLEIQLKPHHLPYKIRQQWPSLLSKYTATKTDDTELDEPVLTFKRNVFYSKDKEVTLQDPNLLELLYEEAKFNILEGRYPCTEANYTMLASWQARIELGSYNPEIHTLAFWRSKLNKFLPRYARRSRWSIIRLSLGGKSGLEAKILEAYCNIASEMQAEELVKKYLEFCWLLPYYGSAFFFGQIETPGTGMASLVLGKNDKDILVAINSEGVFIIDQHGNELILGLKYNEMNWEIRKPTEPDDPDCLPCLFLQFAAFENDKKVYKVLQVFSKQAAMMDALITSFVNEIKLNQEWETSVKMFTQAREPDKKTVFNQPSIPEDDDVNPLKVYTEALEPLSSVDNVHVEMRSNDTKRLSQQLNRLSLATFNEEGECVDHRGSWKIS